MCIKRVTVFLQQKLISPLSLSLYIYIHITDWGREREMKREREIEEVFARIMEGYNGLLAISPLMMREEREVKRDKKGETTMIREKERRDKMSDMYSALQSFVPNLLPKASREQILAGAIQYIQSLEEEKKRLENLKKRSLSAPPPPMTRCTKSGGDVTVSGDGVVLFGIQLVFRRRLATEVFRVFEKHGVEVLAASVAVDGSGGRRKVLTVAATVAVGGGDRVEMIRREILSL